MTYKTVYWDTETQSQQERDCTPEEVVEIEARKTAPLSRDELKAQRDAAVAAIQVTTAAGNTFDGDETSQERMTRAVVALGAAPADTTVNWVLADNSVLDASQAELTEALMLAGAAQAAIWVLL